MFIVFRVAGITGGGSALECFGCMASFTGNCDMLSGERKCRQAMVKFHILPPAIGAVAIGTSLAQLSVMQILRLVAADASHADLRANVVAMTIGTLGFGMGTQQREMSLLGVIKLCALPFINCVAILALRPKLGIVYILQCMAAVAGG